jgi:hypothetical protein
MRMIAQLSGVLAQVLFAKQAGKNKEAGEMIQNAYEELFGLSGELIKSLDAETLAGLLGSPEKIKALATLLKEEGEVFLALKQDAAARQSYAKSLALFNRLLPTEDAAIRDEVAALQSRLE